MRFTTTVLSAAGLLVFGAACGGGAQQTDVESPEGEVPMAEEPAAGTDVAAPITVEDQIASGQQLYGENCAGCHGDQGQGTDKAPPVVGEGALPLDPPAGAKHRTVQFKTAADVAAFVVENMPPGKGGSLTTEEYLAILAFDLKANNVDLTEPLTLEAAQGIVLHPE